MGLFNRTRTIVEAKLNALVGAAEDPRETLDLSYEKQRDMLQQVQRGLIEVTTAKRRLQLQAAQLDTGIKAADGQAQQALAAGREDLARAALERKQLLAGQQAGLEQQITDVQAQQDKLTAAEARLAAKIEAFRNQKEVIKAQYSASEAEVKMGEAFTGVSEEMADVGLAVDRATAKTQEMQARAGAIDELVQQGALSDVSAASDPIQAELERTSRSASVEAELAALKHRVGTAAPAVGGSTR
ncbi:MAG: PspA/IM30 family protein [Chloroflexi bacterium]|nr:PspA/IM30 family protein [Chloroflexota bacterium]